MKSKTGSRKFASHLFLWGLLFAPLVVHAAGLLACLRTEGYFRFARVDFAVFLVAVAYGCGAMLAALNRSFALRFLSLVYAVLVPVGTFELFWLVKNPPHQSLLPRVPERYVLEVANTMPGITGEARFTVNKLGLRGPEIPLAKASVKILCVGGSSVECLYATDEKSWPWLLGTRLSATTGKTVLVGNAGKSGHIALNHEYLLRHYEYAPAFDWVVVMSGVNDMGALTWKNYERRAAEVAKMTFATPTIQGPYYRKLASVRMALSLVGPKYKLSELDSVNQDLGGGWYATMRAKRKLALTRKTITTLPSALPQALAQYRTDLERIIRLCQERHQKLLFLTQPTLYFANMPEHLSRLLWGGATPEGAFTPEVLEQLMNAYNATLVSVCRDHNIDCLDLAGLLPKDTTVLFDDCHFNLAGCERVVELLTGYFLPRLRVGGGSHSP